MLAARPLLGDPATEAARFLCRLALIILMIIAPAAELFSRGALYVLMPVGATILIISGALANGLDVRRVGEAFLTPIGLSALFLLFWSGLSLAWTPFPAEAGERFARALGTCTIVFLAIAFLPERTRPGNLYLLPIGLAVTAVATATLLLFAPPFFTRGQDPDSTLAQRCLVSSAILLWPALGALALCERWLMAGALAFVVAAAAFADFSQIALIAIAAGAFVYAVAAGGPRRIGAGAGFLFAFLVLLAPFLALLGYMLADLLQLPHSGSATAFTESLIADWPRLITGHGLGLAGRAIDLGLLPADTPRSILFTIWYELGLLGAVAFALLGYCVFTAAGRAAPYIAPPFLAGLAAGLVIAILGAETTQLWWMTLDGVGAIAFALLFKAHPHTRRPPAPMMEPEQIDEVDADWSEEEPESGPEPNASSGPA
ncbi:MAG TPA: hypothetical protein VKV77_06325 [Methylovirgula sp.]|nr:hypothetical protein [Methylovirgula sp.]